MEKYFMVSADVFPGESEPFKTKEQAEKWVYEELPISVQKCRTGSYAILEGNLCIVCGDFNETGMKCYKCSQKKEK